MPVEDLTCAEFFCSLKGDPRLLSQDVLTMLNNPRLYVPEDLDMMDMCDHLEEYWMVGFAWVFLLFSWMLDGCMK